MGDAEAQAVVDNDDVAQALKEGLGDGELESSGVTLLHADGDSDAVADTDEVMLCDEHADVDKDGDVCAVSDAVARAVADEDASGDKDVDSHALGVWLVDGELDGSGEPLPHAEGDRDVVMATEDETLGDEHDEADSDSEACAVSDAEAQADDDCDSAGDSDVDMHVLRD